MKNFIIENKTVEVTYANALTSGYGHKKISVTFLCEGKEATFSAVTNNMPGYDAATDLDGQEKSEALYELVDYQLESELTEWLLSF